MTKTRKNKRRARKLKIAFQIFAVLILTVATMIAATGGFEALA